MKNLFLILYLSCSIGYCAAQNRLATVAEFGGASGLVTLNAEYAILQKEKFQVNARAGFGYFPLWKRDLFSVPIGGNLMYNIKNRHHIESGIAVSYLDGLSILWVANEGDGTSFVERAIYFSPSLGYRYDKLESGLILKISYSPLIVLHDYFDYDEYHEIFPSSRSGRVDEWGEEYIPLARNYFGYFSLSAGYRF